MGVGNYILTYLLEEAVARPFHGRLLTLGRQDIFFDRAHLEARAAEKGLRLRPGTAAVFDDVAFFKALGFDEVVASDVSSYEGAGIVLDLNADGIPAEWQSAADCIYDGGTLEHVFNVPNALKNLHALLRSSGRILHSLPVTNFVDHGFYMFSPTLFRDYYEANKYFLRDFKIHRLDPWDNLRGLGTFYEYDPDHWFRFEGGGLDAAQWTMLLTVEKTTVSTSGVVPIQRRYRPVVEAARGQEFDRMAHTGDYLVTRVKDLVAGWKAGNARVVVYGAGGHTETVFARTNVKDASIVGLVDRNPALHGRQVAGIRVSPPALLRTFEANVVLISSGRFQEEIYRELWPLELEGIDVVRLYR